MPSKTERVSIRVAELPEQYGRGVLIARMEHQTGIELALFGFDDPHRLMVQYRPDHFSHNTLLDYLGLHGIHGRIEH